VAGGTASSRRARSPERHELRERDDAGRARGDDRPLARERRVPTTRSTTGAGDGHSEAPVPAVVEIESLPAGGHRASRSHAAARPSAVTSMGPARAAAARPQEVTSDGGHSGPAGDDAPTSTRSAPASERDEAAETVARNAARAAPAATPPDGGDAPGAPRIVPRGVTRDDPGPPPVPAARRSALEVSATVAVPEGTPADEPVPEVRVTIGRIEVNAGAPARVEPPIARVKRPPALSLDDYLARRNGARRGTGDR
jgi:hypothetical protein